MNSDNVLDFLRENGQEALARYIETREPEVRSSLIDALAGTDQRILDHIRGASEAASDKLSGSSDASDASDTSDGRIAPLGALTLTAIEAQKEAFAHTGIEAIREGKLALLLLAGGQGTRLGHDSPKGCFNMGLTKELYIFELLIEHLKEVVREAGSYIHLYVMTSVENNSATSQFFKDKNYFGYNPEHIHFFIQEQNPVLSLDGHFLLSSSEQLCYSPNGNGGWALSLEKAGLIEEMKGFGVEWINVFSVDNVLQRMADPVFFGAILTQGLTSGAKVVMKNAPDEKVGAMCTLDGKPYIIEYYELSEEMSRQTNEDGSLAYGYGVILNYIFRLDKLIASNAKAMPLHAVKKAVPYMELDESGGLKSVVPDSPNAIKFETLALDLVHEMDDCLVFEVDREKEFAPVKNKTGIDSVDTARELLKKNGYAL